MKRCAAMIAVLFAASAVAAEADSGFYIGADIAGIDASSGRSYGLFVATPTLLFTAFPESVSVGGTDASWGAQFGYEFNQFLAVELAYTDYGKMLVRQLYDFSQVPGLPPAVVNDVEFGVSGASVSLLGTIPVTKRLAALLRAGWMHADQDVTHLLRAVLPGQSGRESVSDDVPVFGIGAVYQASEDWSLRFEYQHVEDLHGGDVSGVDSVGPMRIRRFGFGVAFRF